LVGDDKPSRAYIASKKKKAGEAGMVSNHTDLPANASQAQVNDTIAALAADNSVHGILCQFPLPDGLDMEQVLALIPPDKDVDGRSWSIHTYRSAAGVVARTQRHRCNCHACALTYTVERSHRGVSRC
jgi:5,10-methylene-tetrahydrofolate dehydrogenase/methenyl tetrahydrofolate cyclohydrolase